MPWFRTKNFRIWLAGVAALASAAISLAALAQVTGTDAEQRLAMQQRHMERFETFLRDYAAAAASGDCARFRAVDAAYFSDFYEFREMSERDFPPGWLRSAYNRKDTIYKRAECSRFLPAQTALPGVRAKEPDWDPDLYQHFRERVESLRGLRNDRLCDGPQGYNAGLERLRVDIDRSFTEASNAGGDQWRISRPVLEHFDNWHDVAVLLGCDQQIASHTDLPPIAGTYRTSFGAMTLTESGGTYDAKSASLVIVLISGNTAQGFWTQDDAAERCANGSYSGQFRFTFTAEGFTGTYGRCDEEPAREWNGVRDDLAWASRPSTPTATPPLDRPLVASPAPPPTPASVALPPATDPRFPVNAPGFAPLPPVKPAEPSWNAALYRELSERMARIGRLREEGKCDDYEYSMATLSPDLEGEFQYAKGLGGEQFEARRKVIAYFRNWRTQAAKLGCTPPAPAPTVAAPPPALLPFPALQPAQSFWNHRLYRKYADYARLLERQRNEGRCSRFYSSFDQMGIQLDLDLNEETRQGGGNLQSASPVIKYFQEWRGIVTRVGCREGVKFGG
jgi:hypothetical protein